MSKNEDIISCIVVPCYNEEERLPTHKYEAFLKQQETTLICFVNDGSTDKTHEQLSHLKQNFPTKVHVVAYTKNKGKAEAVRTGIQHCNDSFSHKYIAYLDADLSTSLDECLSLTKYFIHPTIFVFGSRIKRMGSNIKRKFHRFLIGRLIATRISGILKIPVYDTQCGCKIFTKNLSELVFKDPFISKWLFDVEIFQRIIFLNGKEKTETIILEVPLKKWEDVGTSKVKSSYMFRLFIDLYTINKNGRKHRKIEKQTINA